MKCERIPISYLFECFVPDYDRGVLTWRQRPLTHFASYAGYKRTNGKLVGKEAFSLAPSGYYTGKLLGISVRRGAVLYAMYHGVWATPTIGHDNRVRHDDRIINLSAATYSEQGLNRSGVAGVYQHRDKWVADYRGKYLGIFNTRDEALTVRREAEEK